MITSLLSDPEFARLHGAIVQKFMEVNIEPNSRLGFDFDGFNYYDLAIPPPKVLDEKLRAKAAMAPPVLPNLGSDVNMGFSKASPPGKSKGKGKGKLEAPA